MHVHTTPPPALSGAHLRTYQTIFQHPVSHNLAWHDVHALLRELGRIDEEHNGNLKATRNGQSLVLPPARTKDVREIAEIMKIRHFIELSETPEAESPPPDDGHSLVVIDHHEARIFRSENHGSVPEHVRADPTSDDSFDPAGFEASARNERRPVPHRYFGAIAEALERAGRILIFGSGTGTASAMDQFVVWLKTHDESLAQRISGTFAVNARHMTDDELLAKARDFYTAPGRLSRNQPPTGR